MIKALTKIIWILFLIFAFSNYSVYGVTNDQGMSFDDCEIVEKISETALDWLETEILPHDEIMIARNHLKTYCANKRSSDTNSGLGFVDSAFFANHLVDVWFRRIDAIDGLYYGTTDDKWKQWRMYIENQKKEHFTHSIKIRDKFVDLWFGWDRQMENVSISEIDKMKWNNSNIAGKYYLVCYETFEIIVPAVKSYHSISLASYGQDVCRTMAQERISSEINFTTDIMLRNIWQTIADITKEYIYEWFMNKRGNTLIDKFNIMLGRFELIVKRYNKRTKQCAE